MEKKKYRMTVECTSCDFKVSKEIVVEPENLVSAQIQYVGEIASKHKKHPDLNNWSVTSKLI